MTLVSQAINLPVHEIPDFFEIRDVNTVLRMHGSVAGLERDAGPDACEKGVIERPGRIIGVLSAIRVQDVLEIGLYRPPGSYLRGVAGLENHFLITHAIRPATDRECVLVGEYGVTADPGVSDTKSKGVVFSAG